MSFKRSVFFLAVFLIPFHPVTAEETPEKKWSVDTSTAFYNTYMFRGENLFDGPSIQPGVTGNYDTGVGIISANLWMHLSASNNDPKRFTELDETIKYTNTYGDFGFAIGNSWYTYPDKSDHIRSTKEIFVSIAYDSYWTPTLSYFYDYDEYNANYYELGLNHTYEEIAEGSEATLTPSVAFGFASNSEKIYDRDGLEFVNVGATLAIPVGEIEVAPNINYSFKVDDNTVNQLWFGVAINYSF